MHTTNDWLASHLARDRAAAAVEQAAAQRLRVTAGVDLHSRIVRSLGELVDRLRAGDTERRARAAAVSRRAGVDGLPNTA